MGAEDHEVHDEDQDLSSCCKLNQNKYEPLLGSSSTAAYYTLSTLSNCSKLIDFRALEQIGATMQGNF